jgi:hypothetical protein
MATAEFNMRRTPLLSITRIEVVQSIQNAHQHRPAGRQPPHGSAGFRRQRHLRRVRLPHGARAEPRRRPIRHARG